MSDVQRSGPAPEVSVVIPHYGDPGPTLDLCRQLLEQTDVDLEVIVADDASPDPIRVEEPVRLVRREVNGGFAANVNSGVQMASGGLCLILNSDVKLRTREVAGLVAAARPYQPCLASPALVSGEGVWQDSRHRWPSALRAAVSSARPVPHLMKWRAVRCWLLDCRPVRRTGPTHAEWVSGAAFMVPTEVLRSVGGLDERYFMFGEDVDLQRRIEAAGLPRLYFREVEMIHLGGGSTDPARAASWSLRARWTYATAYGYAGRLRSLLWATALINLVWNVVARLAGKNVHVWNELTNDVGRARGLRY